MKAALLDWRGILSALAITAGCVGAGGAVSLRDRVQAAELNRQHDLDVQAERDKARDALEARIVADLAAIKAKLGVVP